MIPILFHFKKKPHMCGKVYIVNLRCFLVQSFLYGSTILGFTARKLSKFVPNYNANLIKKIPGAFAR